MTFLIFSNYKVHRNYVYRRTKNCSIVLNLSPFWNENDAMISLKACISLNIHPFFHKSAEDFPIPNIQNFSYCGNTKDGKRPRCKNVFFFKLIHSLLFWKSFKIDRSCELSISFETRVN